MDEQDSIILTSIQKTLSENPNANQRILAENSNISLGMMNAVLKRCISRGWIAVKNLNMKKVCYCLTPEGFEAISKRSTNYLKRSFSMMNEYAGKIVKMVENVKKQGKNRIILFGKSNIQFVIEWACEKCGINFEFRGIDSDKVNINEDDVCLLGELVDSDKTGALKELKYINICDVIEL